MRITLYVIGGFAALLLLGWGLGWFGLFAERPMDKYAKETERQVYTNSVTHQQGANSGIGIDCANMRNVSLSAADRHSYASLVVQDVAAYGGNQGLSSEAQQCGHEAKDLLSQPLNQGISAQ